MSIGWQEAVWERGPRNLSAFSVLHVLANNADDEEGACWPSTAYIAWRSRLSMRTVLRVLEQLESQGWISVERRAVRNVKKNKKVRPGLINRYHLSFAKLRYQPEERSSGDTVSRDKVTRDRMSRDTASRDPVASEKPVKKLRKPGGKPMKKVVSRDTVSRDIDDKPLEPLKGRTVSKYLKTVKAGGRAAPARDGDDGQKEFTGEDAA